MRAGVASSDNPTWKILQRDEESIPAKASGVGRTCEGPPATVLFSSVAARRRWRTRHLAPAAVIVSREKRRCGFSAAAGAAVLLDSPHRSDQRVAPRVT